MPEENVTIFQLLPTHKCEKHGEINNVLHFWWNNGQQKSYCLVCFTEKLEEIGLKQVEKINES